MPASLPKPLNDLNDLNTKTEILLDTDPRCAELETMGYTLVGESWGARLHLVEERERYSTAVRKVIESGISIGELGIESAEEVLKLETTNNPDYPRTPANMRILPTLEIVRDLWTSESRIFGAISNGVLVGVLATSQQGEMVELDFSSILKEFRGQGIGKALASSAIISWFRLGIRTFGTGGAMVNEASLGTVTSLGFVVVERWRSYQPPL